MIESVFQHWTPRKIYFGPMNSYKLQIKISEFLLYCRCIKVAESKLFEYFILVTIVATCFSLALSTPYPNGDSDDLNATLVSAGCRLELITGRFVTIYILNFVSGEHRSDLYGDFHWRECR